MKSWIIKILILIIGISLLTFDVLLYNFVESQKTQLNSVRDKQDVEAEFNSNKFKYEADQIERLNTALDTITQQIEAQKNDLAQQKQSLFEEAEKRQEGEAADKNMQVSQVDIKAEADAIKQEVKGWQKDYASALAGLQKKVDDLDSNMDSWKQSKIQTDNPPVNAAQ